jgi:zinc protease
MGLLLSPLLLLGPVPSGGSAADSPAKGDDPVAKAEAALYEGIRTETLPNGLRIYLKPIPGAATITTMVAYKVGSSDELLDHTGLSHYLEHLMFKGTDKISPGDIDRITLRHGGANNAYTSEDYTIYHFDFASEHWEEPLKIEADRMQNLRIDAKHEFEQEKGAVISELERDEDQPWDLENKAIVPLLFGKTAPYGHPVIGEKKHVRDATAAIIKAHYDKWYHPNNASLIICGGFDPDKVLAKVKELFGPIPEVKLPERRKAPEAKRAGPTNQVIDSKFDVARVIIGFNGVKKGDPDFYALEVAQSVLASGKTGRLYKRLIEADELAAAVDASNMAGRYPGWFSVQAELVKDKSREKAEAALLDELKKLTKEPVTAGELKRVKQGIISSVIFGRETAHDLADSIAQGVTTNDLDYLKTYLAKIRAVTPDDVMRVAKKYFDVDQRVVVWSVPVPAKADKGGAGERGDRAKPERQRKAAGDKAGAGEFSLKDAKKVVLPNGLTLLMFENRRLPIVVAQAFVRNARLNEPEDKLGIAQLTGSLLDEGTSKHTGAEIAEMIEGVGGALGLSSGGGSVKVLTPDREMGLKLLFECLTDPVFPKAAFDRKKEEILSAIADIETKPEDKASLLYHQSVYGKHPFGRPVLGTADTVKKLTIDDLKAFHKKMFVPNNTIVAVVGDFDTKQLTEELTALTADWKKGDLPKPAIEEPVAPEKFVEKIVTMPAAAQLHFYMGQPGIRRNNPDYYKLLVMDYVLGTGPGFTDRLSAHLRDREGLAYTVRANISSSAGEEPGLFTCYIGTEPKNFAKVKGMFLDELNQIREEKAKAEEVEDAKQYLLGNLAFKFTSNEAIADQLLTAERYGLGFGYLDEYRKAVAAVTPDDVLAVAKKYIDPKHMVLVVAGAVDKEGKPLPAPKE